MCNINKAEIYKQVPGYIQIQRKKGGDNFTLYFELDPQTWYYFYYFIVDGLMLFSALTTCIASI